MGSATGTNQQPTHCALCGLPLPRSYGWSANQASGEALYCCSGCRTVSQINSTEDPEGGSSRGLIKLGLGVFFSMNVMVFSMALWSDDLYASDSFGTPLAKAIQEVLRWGGLLFSLPVLFLLGGPIAQSTWQAVRRLEITTDLLILLGVVASYAYSCISVFRGSGDVYFEVSSMVLLFVSIGRWLEARGRVRAGQSLDALAALLPETTLRQTDNGRFEEVPRREVGRGDVIRVRPGERLPVDGTILQGVAQVDQQIVTGESVPVTRGVGDSVYSGTVNLDGDLWVEVSKADGQETISRIIEQVRTARSLRTRHQRIADKVACWFVPLVFLIAIAAGWNTYRHTDLPTATLVMLSVVVIACPCAVGLATPLAVWAALGRAAEQRVLFRSSTELERLAGVRNAAFDKTGTLTDGELDVTELTVFDERDRESVLSAAADVAQGSTHPLSRAIGRYAAKSEVAARPLSVTNHPGLGLSAEVPGLGEVCLGSQPFMESQQLHLDGVPSSEAERLDQRRVYIGWGGTARGVFGLSESPRPGAREAVESCRRLGLGMQILTGDESTNAWRIADLMGLGSRGRLHPEDKLRQLDEWRRSGTVAMVGDGLNDAPALAAADVGVALGCGADVSRDAAGVCLLSDDLRGFPWAVGLARRTISVIRQNLFWAFAYNSVGIGLAATGRLNPVWAAAAMAASSIIVVGNSMRLVSYPGPLEAESVEASESPTNESPSLAEANEPSLVEAS